MTGMDFVAKVEFIDPAARQIALRGTMHPVSEKLSLNYYKIGDMVEAKINAYGTVVFLKKQTAQAAPPAGFVPAAQLQQEPAPVQKAAKYDPNTMLWCNSVNSAIEVLRIQWEPMTPTELQEIDMWDQVIVGARKFYNAGLGRDHT